MTNRQSQTAAWLIAALGSVVAVPGVSRAQTAAALIKPAVALVNSRGPAVSVSSPVLGYFFDRASRVLQPVLGIPGSGYLGDALTARADVLAISPGQDYALAFSAESGQTLRISLSQPDADPLSVQGLMGSIDQIAISPAGTAAVFVSVSAARVWIVTGLPDAPRVASELGIAGLAVNMGPVAVNDAGDVALVTSVSDQATVYALRSASAPAVLYRTQSISSLAFLRNSSDALVAASGQNQAVWLRDVSGTASAMVVADAQSGLSSPAAIASSQDGTRAFVLGAAGILSVPLSGMPASLYRCACKPSVLQRMAGRDVFLLTDAVDSPLAVFDGDSPSPGISSIRVDLPRPAQLEKVSK